MLGLSNSMTGLALSRRGAAGAPAPAPAPAPAWSPVELYAAAQEGLFWDTSDMATLYQDTAMTTPVTAVGQAVRAIADKSGRGFHGLRQAESTADATLAQDEGGRLYVLSPSGHGFMTVGKTMPNAAVEVLAGVRRINAGQWVAFNGLYGDNFFAGACVVNSSYPQMNAGSPVYVVDGVLVNGGTNATRTDLDSAMTVGANHVLELQGASLSGWGEFGAFLYFPTWSVDVRMYPLAMRTQLSDSERTQLRTWMGAKAGLTL